MTIHIQMLQDIATHARAMADAMQAIVDDCAEQLAKRKAAGESEESIMSRSRRKVRRTHPPTARRALRLMTALRPSMRSREARLLQRRLSPLPRPRRS
mgnify:CR=1 FL=1